MKAKLMELAERAKTEHGYNLAHEIAEVARSMEMTSVDDGLPNRITNVLVKQAYQDDLMIAFINKEGTKWVENCENATVNGDAWLSTDICAVSNEEDYLKITHWMPIPKG